MLTLSAEALFKVLLGNEACVANIKMMESKGQIGIRDCLSTIDGDREEFRVIDLAVVIKIDSFEDLCDFILRHVQLVKGCSDFTKLERARVVGVKGAESVPQQLEIEGASIRLVHQEGECFDLEGFRLAEVLDSTKH